MSRIFANTEDKELARLHYEDKFELFEIWMKICTPSLHLAGLGLLIYHGSTQATQTICAGTDSTIWYYVPKSTWLDFFNIPEDLIWVSILLIVMTYWFKRRAAQRKLMTLFNQLELIDVKVSLTEKEFSQAPKVTIRDIKEFYYFLSQIKPFWIETLRDFVGLVEKL